MPFNGTIVGSPTFAAGKFGNAMGCSVGNGCSLPSGGPLQFSGSSTMTLEFWFKASTPPGSLKVVIGARSIFSIDTDSSGQFLYDGASRSATAICDGAWHALAMSYDGTNSYFFVDGVLGSTVTGNPFGVDAGAPETVGTGFNNSTSFDMSCSIDELCISNICQYTTNYTPAVAPFANSRAGAVALYHFEADATDSAGSSPVATKVVVTTQPAGSTAAGAPFSLVVSVEDVSSSVVFGSTANVTVAIGTNPSSGTLSGTLTVAAVAGVATFTGLSINNVGTGYTLVATSPGLTSATSSAFNITGILAASGNLFVTSVAPGNVQITANIAAGTAPFVYAWYKSTTVNFTPGGGNLLVNGGGIGGATTATLTDTTALTPGTAYYYVCVVTDAIPNTVTFPHRPVYAALPSIKICTIGDSTSVFTSPWTQQYLQTSRGVRQVTMVNTAVNGSEVMTWWNGSPQANLTTALAACGGSFSGFLVLIRLGINEAQNAVSAVTVATNLAGLVAYVIAHGGIPFLSYPTWREPGSYAQGLPGTVLTFDETTTPFLLQYHAAIDALINGTTIFAGDRTSYALLAELAQDYLLYNPPTYTDLTNPGAIHPALTGSQVFGLAEAAAVLAYLYPVAAVFNPVTSSLVKASL